MCDVIRQGIEAESPKRVDFVWTGLGVDSPVAPRHAAIFFNPKVF